ncbi:MAG: YidC/Oxa1 family membrane protein insertase [Marinicellaceae bacterium]
MKLLINKFFAFVFMYLIMQVSISHAASFNFDLNNASKLNAIIETQVKDTYGFNGLAIYLNQVQYYVVDEEQIQTLNRTQNSAINLTNDQWLAITGRFNVLLIQSKDAEINFDSDQKIVISSTQMNPLTRIVDKSQLNDIAPELNQIRYNHLWKPFAVLSRLFESLLILIKDTTTLSWGFCVILFAIIIKLVLWPVSILTAKTQQNVSKINSQLQPKLAEIKSKYKGEKAHHYAMKAHKELGVSPFFTLKPMLSFFIQIPILIALFNTLGEMPQLINQPFLWFNDLSQPDMLIPLGFSIPFLGSYLNLMPLTMTFVTLSATLLHKDKHASNADLKKQRLKLYLMSASFLILFYPFPAAMVMYWTVTNLISLIQQKIAQR